MISIVVLRLTICGAIPPLSHIFKAPVLLQPNIFFFLLTMPMNTEGIKYIRNVGNRVRSHMKHLALSVLIINHHKVESPTGGMDVCLL
jgi:hypothetical protein